LGWLSLSAWLGLAAPAYFEIQVVDRATGRGVPLVELETVDHQRFITDNAGRVAFSEPGLMDRPVFFTIRSHGYEFPRDGFGSAGLKLTPRAGQKQSVSVDRHNIAERLYRVTGRGLYRDSLLLGYPSPVSEPALNGEVLGQDSVQPVLHRGKLYQFWGDTSRASYPLGNFRTTGAWADLPGHGGLDPSLGINLHYFTGADGFVKPMCPFDPPGDLIWLDGVLTVKDAGGHDVLLAHWLRLKGLGAEISHGLAIFDDVRESFRREVELDLAEKWRVPQGHPLRVQEDGVDYFHFGYSFPNVRVKADYASVLDPQAYEAWTCLVRGSSSNVARRVDGALDYRWTREASPMTADLERSLAKSGAIKTNEVRLQPLDVASGKPVQIHGGSVRWSPWRKCWIMIAVEQAGTSFLGEVWYLEASHPTGPWRKAAKVVTHNKYTFYNPVHHEYFDAEGGRRIYFEGTYCNTFSGNNDATPLYDYNQVMYRLDLADPRLDPLRR
jgi:hypothetical protein